MSNLEIQKGIIKVKEIIPNPVNPRSIKGEKFTKLKNSILEFPDMLELRPLVIDENNIVIGGNMRLKALKELKIEEVPFIRVMNLDEEKKKEFVIKDNTPFGDWDWGVLVSDWESEDLADWGLDIPSVYLENEGEPEFDKSPLYDQLESYANNKIKQITLYFDTKQYEDALAFLKSIQTAQGLESNTEAFVFLMEKHREEASKL